ncbi:MAG: methyl-accepting chemotaxis protein [Rhodospirillales bacterium]|nr:methyl-accepting chemotaxis protein [Rhodospirillales bacterium]
MIGNMDRMADVQGTVSNIALILGILGTLIGVVVAWYLNRAVSTPIGKLTEVMNALASGELDKQILPRPRR